MICELQEQVQAALSPRSKVVSKDIISWRLLESRPEKYYVKFFPNNLACKVNMTSEHDESIVLSFLDEVTMDFLRSVDEEKPFSLSASTMLAKTVLDQRALLHPSISRGAITSATGFMNDNTYQTFPVHDCEFRVGESLAETKTRINRIVSWAKWDRTPCPVIDAKVVRSAFKRKGRFETYSLSRFERAIVGLREHDGYVDLQNYEGKDIHLKIENQRCEISSGEEKWIQSMEKLKPWLRSFLSEGFNRRRKRKGRFL